MGLVSRVEGGCPAWALGQGLLGPSGPSQPTDPASIHMPRPQPGSLPELPLPSSAQTLNGSPLLDSSLTHPAGNPQAWRGGVLSPIPQRGSLPPFSCSQGFPPASPWLHGMFFKKCFTSRVRAASPVTLPVSSRDPRVHTSLGTSTHPSLEVQEAH